MKIPLPHPQEAERLKALESLQILDTLPESEFDELTQLASYICKTPISLISLVDDKRQWFKSKVGISVNEIPKECAFCAHAILQDDIFIIQNSLMDDRFSDNPLVTNEPHVHFYAGVPIVDPVHKLPIGTICVIDHNPRQLDDFQVNTLKTLANQIFKLLELRIQLNTLSAANKKLHFQKVAFDNMTEGIIIQNILGQIIEYNKAALDVLDLSAEQLLEKTSLLQDRQFVKEDGSLFLESEHPAMIVLRTGQNQRNIVMGLKTKSEIKWLNYNATPIFQNENEKIPTHVLTTLTDITKEKNAQQSLLQSAKMTSLGEMAGGIAHEINTPLTVIHLASRQIQNEICKTDKLDGQKILEKAKKIESTGNRISEIVRGLKTFSRNSTNDPWQKTSLKGIVLETTSLCQEKFKYSGIQLSTHILEDVEVNCIPTQISQIILNLLNNSYDAVSELPEKWIKIELKQLDSFAVLRISDSGLGIPANIESKMMQPFFTTKELGKGTGLGLSISKGIADSFKGSLKYEIDHGHTSFVLRLPVAQ